MSSDQQGRWPLSRVAMAARFSRMSRLFSHQSKLLAAGQQHLPLMPAPLVMEGLHKSALELSRQVADLERRLEVERMAHPNDVRGFHLFAMASAFLLVAAAAAFLTDQLAAGSSLVPPSVATIGLICGVWLGVATGAVVWANRRADG